MDAAVEPLVDENADPYWHGIFTITRINPKSYSADYVHTAVELNEVCLKPPSGRTSTVGATAAASVNVFCDLLLDDVQARSKDKEKEKDGKDFKGVKDGKEVKGVKDSFASQDDVWEKFREASKAASFHHLSDSFAVVALGSPASGKSYCLFGDLNPKKNFPQSVPHYHPRNVPQNLMGIVPRYIQECFMEDFEFNPFSNRLLQMSMYILMEETVSLFFYCRLFSSFITVAIRLFSTFITVTISDS